MKRVSTKYGIHGDVSNEVDIREIQFLKCFVEPSFLVLQLCTLNFTTYTRNVFITIVIVIKNIRTAVQKLLLYEIIKRET